MSCFFLFGVGVMFVEPPGRWDAWSPIDSRLVAASTDPHNAALCVAMDAHLAVVRSAAKMCCAVFSQMAGVREDDQKPMLVSKDGGQNILELCMHTYGIRYIYVYNILYIFMQ